jgi:hypothetical protein
MPCPPKMFTDVTSIWTSLILKPLASYIILANHRDRNLPLAESAPFPFHPCLVGSRNGAILRRFDLSVALRFL